MRNPLHRLRSGSRMKTFSLRMRLIAWLLGGLLAVWCAAASLTYLEAHEEVDELADLRLVQVAHAYALADISRLRESYPPDDGGRSTRRGADLPDDDDGYGLPLFQRFDRTGRLLMSDRLSDSPPFDARAGLSDVDIDGVHYRSAAVWHDALQTRVFEPHRARGSAASSVLRRLLLPLAAALPLLVFMVWWIVSRGLGPLRDLARVVEARDAANLAPLDASEMPEEAAPLVSAVNRLLSRLELAIDQERRFTADAAHELRTPLSGLKLHAQIALASKDPAEQRDALNALIGGVDRAAHLFEQMLMLSRADRGESVARTPVDLGGIVRRVADSFGIAAAARGTMLSVQAEHGLRMLAAPVLVDALVRNLIDNALRYSPDGSKIEIIVARTGGECVLTVRDNGVGIEPACRARAVERFTRLTGADTTGSGLGLSIVARIARSHEGTLMLDEGIDGRGLAVRVAFPALCDSDRAGDDLSAAIPTPSAGASRSPA